LVGEAAEMVALGDILTVLAAGIVCRQQAQPTQRFGFDQMDSNGPKAKFLIGFDSNSTVDWVLVVGTTQLVGWMSFKVELIMNGWGWIQIGFHTITRFSRMSVYMCFV
jgi:hypothetical protein